MARIRQKNYDLPHSGIKHEEAVKFYVSIFPNSKMTSLIGSGEGTVGRKGSAGGATFQLDGREFMEYNAGPHFNFAEGMSLYVDVVPKERSTCCGTSSPREEKREDAAGQGQVRRVMADSAVYFGEMLQDKDPERSKKVMAAMLKMETRHQYSEAGLREMISS